MSGKLGLPLLVFVGRKFHEKTQSDRVMIELLQKHYRVIVLRREELSDQTAAKEINQLSPQVVFFWCLPPSSSYHLMKLKCKNIVWAPMCDGFEKLTLKKRWLFYWHRVKVLCFSKALYKYFQTTRLSCQFAQCFLEPKTNQNLKDQGPYTFFLWEREAKISLQKMVDMIGKEHIEKVIYKSDDGQLPSVGVPIEKLPQWMEKDAYIEKVRSCDYFIAPRTSEGIGFSFLEPMSLGKAIIAYDNATMNEYIEDGVNGYLFDDRFKLSKKLQSPLSLSKAIENKQQQLHKAWQKQQKEILSFIQGRQKV